jgi:hypothetical protein
MSKSAVRLTPLLRSQIVAGIRSGGFPHVAAEAWGLSQEMFKDWLRRGSGNKPREPYASFAREVRDAEAQARLRAELAVFTDEPKVWLEHGPGRELQGRPGWTTAVKAAAAAEDAGNILLHRQTMALLQNVLEWLTPFPEARIHVARLVPNERAA